MSDLRSLSQGLRQIKADLVRADTQAKRRIANAAVQEAKLLSSGAFRSLQLAQMGRPYATRNASAGPEPANAPLLTRRAKVGPLGKQMPHGYVDRISPIPYGDARIINRQTGIFRASWRIKEFRAFGGVALIVYNVASYAKFLETGTKWMIPRRIDVLIEKKIDLIGPEIYLEEIQRVFQRSLAFKAA